jgi:hypothetical protein
LNGLQGWAAKMPSARLKLDVRPFHVAARIKHIALLQDAINKKAIFHDQNFVLEGLIFIFSHSAENYITQADE